MDRTAISNNTIPVTRVLSLLPYTDFLRSIGAPVELLLTRTGISPDLLNHPSAAIPLERAFKLAELSCKTQGTEHIGLHVGLTSTLDDLGPYGQMLQGVLTMHDYLYKGISLHNMLSTGQRFWLSGHGNELRFNFESEGDAGVGKYQAEVETLAFVINQFKKAAEKTWSPRVISLAYKSREDLPDNDLFAGSRVLRGTGENYFTIPRDMMGLRFSGSTSRKRVSADTNIDERRLPENLASLVQLQIETMLPTQSLHIDDVADSLAMSTRGLQRRLAKQGKMYSQVLADSRISQAVGWLENSNKPITDIAFDLGYQEASNFTRAFRRHLGVSPHMFRRNARKTLETAGVVGS